MNEPDRVCVLRKLNLNEGERERRESNLAS